MQFPVSVQHVRGNFVGCLLQWHAHRELGGLQIGLTKGVLRNFLHREKVCDTTQRMVHSKGLAINRGGD